MYESAIIVREVLTSRVSAALNTFLFEVSRMGEVIKMRYWIHGKLIAGGAPNGNYFVEVTRDSPIRSEADLNQIAEELSASVQATDDRGRSLTVKVQILAFSLFAN